MLFLSSAFLICVALSECNDEKNKDSKKDLFCENSEMQLCRMICDDPPKCGDDECVMRTNNCCDMECQKAKKKPQICKNSPAPSCPPTTCGDNTCPGLPECAEDECVMETPGYCCALFCKKNEEDKPREKCPGYVYKRPTFCTGDDDCSSDEFCNTSKCVYENCDCLLDAFGKELMMCHPNVCLRGCEKKEETACTDFLCTIAEPSFSDVKNACREITDLDFCKNTGCGKKMKKGKCVAPKNAKKIKCKSVKDMSLCEKYKCKSKKRGTKCTGKTRL